MGDNVDNALKVKEAPLIENKLVLRAKEHEQKRKLSNLISISGSDDITSINGVPLEHTKGK